MKRCRHPMVMSHGSIRILYDHEIFIRIYYKSVFHSLIVNDFLSVEFCNAGGFWFWPNHHQSRSCHGWQVMVHKPNTDSVLQTKHPTDNRTLYPSLIPSRFIGAGCDSPKQHELNHRKLLNTHRAIYYYGDFYHGFK